jgi:hypothetical protein
MERRRHGDGVEKIARAHESCYGLWGFIFATDVSVTLIPGKP